MKTRSSSRPASGEERRGAANAQSGAQLKQATVATMPDARAASLALLQHQDRASNSSQATQLKATADMMAGRSAGAPVQRVDDEELLQGRFAVAQREEDEELLQGKFAPVQRMDDEELLQGKFTTAQRVEDEDLLQGKFDPVQRMDEEELLQGKFAAQPATQLEAMPNNTGMPNQLKSGIESLSGMSMDHVKVHYNSDKPAQLNAHAYAQGSDIHMAPGQEQHLPHEAWHVVQQMQGRVRPTMQMKGDVPVNDDVGLEAEADVMGAKALTVHASDPLQKYETGHSKAEVRQNYAIRVVSDGARHHYEDGWGEQYGITDDDTLIASVPKAVRGAGWIDLGSYDAPDAEQVEGDRRFKKQCWIGYANAKQEETTLITHCGPSGKKQYYG